MEKKKCPSTEVTGKQLGKNRGKVRCSNKLAAQSESRREMRAVNQPCLQRIPSEISIVHKGGWWRTAEAFVREDKKKER